MFVPRTVKKKQALKPGQPSSSLAPPPPPPPSTAGAPSTSSSSASSLPSPPPSITPARPSTVLDVPNVKSAPKASLSEAKNAELQAVALFELVFSDHALWTKDDLHLVARSNQNEGCTFFSLFLLFLVFCSPEAEADSRLGRQIYLSPTSSPTTLSSPPSLLFLIQLSLELFVNMERPVCFGRGSLSLNPGRGEEPRAMESLE